MLIRQATVQDIKNSRITKRHGFLVLVTRLYPRYFKKLWIDEYLPQLAPTRELLDDFLQASKEAAGDHARAFESVGYESRFSLEPAALTDLQRLAEVARERDVYLICHCGVGECCHREILMLIAEQRFAAKVARLHRPWATIRRRLADGSLS